MLDPQAPQQQGISVNINDLLAKIGALIIERDFLVNQVNLLQAKLNELLTEKVGELEDEPAEQLGPEIE